MSEFLQVNTYPELPSYIRKKYILSIHMSLDIPNSQYPYTIWINTSQTCMSEKFENYEKGVKRLDELIKLIND